ncbi:helix-turn-helix domain-containing protein [Streptomyces sp. 4F14]|uniref:helix-turn-helix domain-containing protein n=1 Tax=Streptomyces sp. 4F14 TaxID=3394380 RepID=UPI003A88F538
MDTLDISSSPRTQSRPSDGKHPNRRHPHAGLVHDNTRHTDRFTVIGNHLAQHPDLSLLAIGLGTHIQSLPAGSCISIRHLAGRFPEGPDRIAGGLRELEHHGYLRRKPEQVQGGRFITRTVSCNQPDRTNRAAHKGSTGADAEDCAAVDGCAGDHASGDAPGEDAENPDRPGRPHHSPSPCPNPPHRPRTKALPPVPQPSCTVPGIFQKAAEVLTDLRRHDPRLYLSAADVAHLAPGVAAWLEREVSPGTVRRALVANLPADPLHRPASFVAHRLTALLPPVPYFGPGRPVLPVYPAPDAPPATGADSLVPVQPVVLRGPREPTATCPGCDRPYRRGTAPGTHCRDCRPPEPVALR